MSENGDQNAQRIIVGVDGSAPCREALRWGARIAEPTGASIEAIITWQVPAGMIGGSYVPVEWNPADEAEKVLSDAVEQAYGSHRPAGLSTHVREGEATQILLEESEHAEMLVVGSRGLGGFAGLLLGSVSAKCAEHARCPVLVVHEPQPPSSEPRST